MSDRLREIRARVAAVQAHDQYPESFTEAAQVARNNLSDHAVMDIRFLLAHLAHLEQVESPSSDRGAA